MRYWPFLAILALVWICRSLPLLAPESGFLGFIVSVMGPLALAIVTLIVFVFFSRASWKEGISGVAALVVLGTAANQLCHPSVQGIGLMLYGIPWAVTGFAVALAVFSRAPPLVRTGLATAAAAVPLFALVPMRIDGISSNMTVERRWRWEPSKQDEFDALLKSRSAGAASAAAGDWRIDGGPEWGEFRGPDRDGKKRGVVLADDWSSNPPREVWRTRIGAGWGAFCVAGDRLFTQEQRGDSEAVVCYSAKDGTELWSHLDPGRFSETIGGPGPRATPTFHDGRLYALGATGTLNCLDPADGRAYWTADLKTASGAQPPMWGFSSSPLVVAGLVVVHAGGTGRSDVDAKTHLAPHGLVAYDAQTGDVKWTAPAGDHSYSSAQLQQPAGDDGKQLVLMLTNAGLAAHEPATGEIAWEHPWPFDGYRVIQPMQLDEKSWLLGTTMGVGTRRISVVQEESGYTIREEWTSTKMKPYFNDFVEHKGYLYGFDHDVFACVNLETGAQMWKKGRYGDGQVLLLPDGDQLLVTSESGDLVLLDANPKQFRELAKFKVFEGKTWNHPVVVEDRIFLRNAEEAVCLKVGLAK